MIDKGVKETISPEAAIVEEKRGSFTIHFISFAFCKECGGRGYVYQGKYPREYDAEQCLSCLKRNESWKKRYPVFYRISTLHLPGKVIVSGYAEIDGEHEPLIMEYTEKSYSYEKEFETREAAQAWIAEQHGGDISRFWKGMK